MDNTDIERHGGVWQQTDQPDQPEPVPRRTVAAVLRQNKRTYCDGIAAALLCLLWQLLICGLQQLTPSIDDFPAAILAMILVAASMILASKFFANLDSLYLEYLRGPTDLINRHMSIGFTVPFTMIMKGPMSSPRNVGIIIAGFIITGVLNTFFVFGISMIVQSTLMAIRRPRCWRTAPRAGSSSSGGGMPYPVLSPLTLAPLGFEATSSSSPAIPTLRVQPPPPPSRAGSVPASPASPTAAAQGSRIPSYVSESSTLADSPSEASSNSTGVVQHQQTPAAQNEKATPGQTAAPRTALATRAALAALQTRAHSLACFAAAHPVLSFSLVAIPLVGIPVSVATGSDAALDSFVLFALWTGMLATQAAVKHAASGPFSRTSPTLRNVVSTLLNAVLWSSLGALAYLAAKAAARHRSLDDALDAFSTSTTLADIIAIHQPSHYMGAGDIASSILNAGIVSWGLKLFECRRQLLSRAGITTLVVGSIIALGNIVCGPFLVHCMGLAPRAKVLSFAARSVTLALAGPAMKNMGGDVGLNAAMVVFNGIVFQVAMGLGLYRWVGVQLAQFAQYATATSEELLARSRAALHAVRRPRLDASGPGMATASAETHVASSRRTSQTDFDTLHDRSPSAMSTASSSSSSSSSSVSEGAIIKDVISAAAAAANGQPATADNGGASLALSPSYGSYHSAFVGHMRGGGGGGEAASFLSCTPDSASAISAGMTIGINAAAMGTAYLYEDGSRAAPYAVLAMTVFGVMTVVFTSIQPLAAWVISTVS